MVFYIEACESGSMMNHLADNINGEPSVNLMDIGFSTCHRQDLYRYCVSVQVPCTSLERIRESYIFHLWEVPFKNTESCKDHLGFLFLANEKLKKFFSGTM